MATTTTAAAAAAVEELGKVAAAASTKEENDGGGAADEAEEHPLQNGTLFRFAFRVSAFLCSLVGLACLAFDASLAHLLLLISFSSLAPPILPSHPFFAFFVSQKYCRRMGALGAQEEREQES